METYLLDTNILIDSINRRNRRPESLDRLIGDGILLVCCSINITEVYMGMRPHEREKTENFLRSLEFYPVTWEIARYAGELYNEMRQQGRTLSLPDVTIAAVCLTHDLTLMTDNPKDFPMPELRLHSAS
ncbi:MAG: type II toxin-antitoxin system VapC family toxin [Bryobacteraceae bacterium]